MEIIENSITIDETQLCFPKIIKQSVPVKSFNKKEHINLSSMTNENYDDFDFSKFIIFLNKSGIKL